jgi:hypothetical protein
MLPMTRHKALHTGLVSPSPLDRWINALLRGFAMLVSFVVSICSMRLTCCPAECHSDAALEALPCKESGKLKETTQAAASRQSAYTSFTALTIAAQSAIAKEGPMLRTIAQAIVDAKRSLAVRAADELIQWINSSAERPEGRAGLIPLSTSHSRACPTAVRLSFAGRGA